MSSEDLKKHIRTQGKYSATDLMKGRDKKPRVSPKDKNEKKVSKRYSEERRKSDEQSSSVKYQENATGYAYNKLDEPVKPVEISTPGKHVISKTERGESLIYYKPDFFEKEVARDLFNYFESTTTWNTKNIVIRRVEYPQPRLVAWYGPYPYSYSGTTLEAAEMPDGVIKVKRRIEAFLKEQGVEAEFNSVLLNMYRDEKDSVAWHSDDELTMGICPTIASISLGEVRRFEIRPKKRYDEQNQLESPEMYMNLCHGSLVVMDGCMQEDWQHRIPKEYHDKERRINLTFRTVFPIDERPCLPEKEYLKQYVAATSSSKATNSGREIQFNDEEFPTLDSTVKTSGKLGGPSELSISNIGCDNKNDDKNWEESACEDTKSEDESIDTSGALVSSPEDTREMERPVVRERDRFHGREKRQDATFERSRDDQMMSPNDATEKPSSGFVSRRYARDGVGFRGRDKRENKSFQRSFEDKISPNHTAENPKRDMREGVRFHGRDKREDVTFGKSRLDYPEPHFRQSNRGKDRFSRNQEMKDEISPDHTAENPQRDMREGVGFHGREKREDVTVGKSRLEPPHYRQSVRGKGRFSKNQNPAERGPPQNFNHNDRINRQPDREREERQNCNSRSLDPRERRYREDEIEPRLGRYEGRREENEERSPRGRANDNVMRQNNNVRQGNSSYVPRGRNSQSRDENCYDQRVPQTQYVDRRNDIKKFNDLPPRYSKIRNQPVHWVEDEDLSEESFDNNKHASEVVRKEHYRPDHNEARLNFTLNVAANEFVPKCRMPDRNYNRMSLKDLVCLDIEQMKDCNLQLHAESLKSRVLEIRDEFEPDEKEDLDFLCALTDGSQNDKNQRLISSKMAEIVHDYTNRNSEIRRSF